MSTALLVHPRPADPPEPYDGMPVSEADYWEFYYLGYDVTYEWSNGILEEKGVSDYQTFRTYDWFIRLLIEFLNAHPMADRVGLMMGFRLALPNKTAIRRPDYSVVRHDNPVQLLGPMESYPGIFNLCIEAVSTSSKAKQEQDTVVKRDEYAAGSVAEYYLLHHSPKLRRFYRLNAQGVYDPLPVAPGGIICSTVLPGFQWRVDDLDRQPSLETLLDDPVYQGYVRLLYRQERQRAEQERQRAEQAERNVQQQQAQTEQERQRAERLTAQLRALGIEPDDKVI